MVPEEWSTKAIKSIRWLLVEVGGKLAFNGRRMILKIATDLDKISTYLEMRRRTFELLQG